MTIPLRILLTIGCALLGFLFPLMFLLAACIGWSIYEDITNPPDKIANAPPAKPEPMTRARMSDLCESPAETAFLDAMHSAFDLETSSDALVGGGIRLRSQVKVLRYRLDFLVDDRLVVEIDGAQWHSSPEAVERDRIRDLDLQGEGYSICRIPAKIVLYRPREAIVLMKAARAAIRDDALFPEPKHPDEVHSSSEPVGIQNVLGVIAKGIDDLDSKVAKMTTTTQISCFLAKFFQTMEIILELTSEQMVRDIQIAKRLGTEPDDAWIRKSYRELMMQICRSIDDNITARADIYADLPLLKRAISTEYGREHFNNIAENVVDEHLETLTKFHDVIFSDRAAFREGLDGKFDAREDIITQLRAICFDGADPVEFAHPYCPPLCSIFFKDWWIRNVAGGKPIIRKAPELMLFEG